MEPCPAFRVDMTARAYGVCKCGHLKSEHPSRVWPGLRSDPLSLTKRAGKKLQQKGEGAAGFNDENVENPPVATQRVGLAAGLPAPTAEEEREMERRKNEYGSVELLTAAFAKAKVEVERRDGLEKAASAAAAEEAASAAAAEGAPPAGAAGEREEAGEETAAKRVARLAECTVRRSPVHEVRLFHHRGAERVVLREVVCVVDVVARPDHVVV